MYTLPTLFLLGPAGLLLSLWLLSHGLNLFSSTARRSILTGAIWLTVVGAGCALGLHLVPIHGDMYLPPIPAHS